MDSFEERWVWVGITCGQRELGERNITNSLHELATWIEVDFNGCSSVAGRSRTAALARERATLPHRHRSTLHVYYTVLQHNNRYWIERRDGLCSRFSRIINYIYCIKTMSFKNGEYEVKDNNDRVKYFKYTFLKSSCIPLKLKHFLAWRVKFAIHTTLESHKQEINQTIYEIPERSEEKTIKNRQNTYFTKTAN